MRNYLNQYMRICLSKVQHEAPLKQHPRHNLAVCHSPKLEFLEKRDTSGILVRFSQDDQNSPEEKMYAEGKLQGR